MRDREVVVGSHAVLADSSVAIFEEFEGRIARTLRLIGEEGAFAERDLRDLEAFAVSCAGYASIIDSNAMGIRG